MCKVMLVLHLGKSNLQINKCMQWYNATTACLFVGWCNQHIDFFVHCSVYSSPFITVKALSTLYCTVYKIAFFIFYVNVMLWPALCCFEKK